MAVFNYVAVNEHGKTKKGILEGDSISQVRQTLMDRGLTPIEIFPTHQEEAVSFAETTSWWQRFLKRRVRVPVSHLAILTYQFATLLTAGLPVESALASMAAEIENPRLKRMLFGVRSKVVEGHSLATGMRDYPSVFPNLYTASVAVGEQTGQLDKVLVRLADYYEGQRQVQEKIFQALVYPTLLTLVSVAIVVFLLAYVIPQITSVFAETGQTLPGVTLFLLALSNGLKDYGLYILLVIILAAATFYYSLRRLTFRYRVQHFLLKVPVIGQTIIAINAARFSRTFGILFAAGVPVLEAMTSANSILTLLPMRDAIAGAIVKVGEGTSIHKALQQTGYISSLSNQLIASGETSGNLELMLEKAASFQEKITSNRLSVVLSLFEPILIITMGGIVLFIVLAVLLPIFAMNQLVQ